MANGNVVVTMLLLTRSRYDVGLYITTLFADLAATPWKYSRI